MKKSLAMALRACERIDAGDVLCPVDQGGLAWFRSRASPRGPVALGTLEER